MIVCVGIPTIDGKPCAQTVDSLLAEQLIALRQGVHLLVLWQIGTSLIGPARNLLAKQFLDIKEANSMVFVDSDISWAAGDLLKIALSDFDVVGATYRSKQEEVSFHVLGKPEKHGDFYKVDGLPGGFIKVSRKAYETIKAVRYEGADGMVVSDYFPTGIHNGVLYGEDYGFCRLWREFGGDVMLDPSIVLRHHDGGRAFTGSPKEWIEEQINGSE